MLSFMLSFNLNGLGNMVVEAVFHLDPPPGVGVLGQKLLFTFPKPNFRPLGPNGILDKHACTII